MYFGKVEAHRPNEQFHEYCRQLKSAAFWHCEHTNTDPYEMVEGLFPLLFFHRWQIVADDLLKSFSDRFPPEKAEQLRTIGYQYVLDYGNASVGSNMLH